MCTNVTRCGQTYKGIWYTASVKVKIHTLAFANREGPLMVFHKGLINSNYWTTIVANLVSFSILRFHIGFLKSVSMCHSFKTFVLVLALQKCSYLLANSFKTCSMSTLESASCPHVQDRVLQEANILNIERLVKKLKSISASDAATE